MPAENTPDAPLGSFEPAEARRLLPILEQRGIAFQIEPDHSALARPGRFFELAVGMYPEGSKIAVYVTPADLNRATDAVRTLFPS